ncbi:MAG: SEC-C domain-containing protein, partial [Clostridia bacterium]|nr:SEC-C domain-containing protein [Clostridia bacterium]
MLNVIDKYWTDHINTMSHLREGIHLRSYGQNDPLRAYTVEGFELFDNMMQKIDQDVTTFLIRAEVKQNMERKEVTKNKITNDGKDTAKAAPKKSQKVGRNDPCPCGSGKKYKQCCGK